MKLSLAALLVAAAAVAATAMLGGGDVAPAPDPRAERAGTSDDRAPRRPNLLVVMVDDQPTASFGELAMPKTLDFFAGGGSVFDQAIAAPPLCCPARAGFLTGRYAHNHGVVENDVGYATMQGKRRTFPVALEETGYRTAMIGKFLNGYGAVAGSERAPGFQRWFAMLGYADYFDYEVIDGDRRRVVSRYATRELTAQARDFVRSSADRPFFLWLAYNAPHWVLPDYPPPCNGQVAQPPDPAAFEPFADVELPRPPSFDAADVSSRPSLAGHRRLDRGDVEEATRAWRCSLAAMSAVDDQLARLFDALRKTGQLEETVVVYVSDNGEYFGEHRLTADKRLPLEPALRVPMAIRVGERIQDGPAPARIEELVSQVDLAPTLLDYAGVPLCPRKRKCAPMDGRSLRGLLGGEEWPSGRGIPLTLADGWTYEAIRTDRELYMELEQSRKREFAKRRRELYDLTTDPDQLRNLAAEDDAGSRERLRGLGRRLDALTTCAGIEGRDPPGERPFCE